MEGTGTWWDLKGRRLYSNFSFSVAPGRRWVAGGAANGAPPSPCQSSAGSAPTSGIYCLCSSRRPLLQGGGVCVASPGFSVVVLWACVVEVGFPTIVVSRFFDFCGGFGGSVRLGLLRLGGGRGEASRWGRPLQGGGCRLLRGNPGSGSRRVRPFRLCSDRAGSSLVLLTFFRVCLRCGLVLEQWEGSPGVHIRCVLGEPISFPLRRWWGGFWRASRLIPVQSRALFSVVPRCEFSIYWAPWSLPPTQLAYTRADG